MLIGTYITSSTGHRHSHWAEGKESVSDAFDYNRNLANEWRTLYHAHIVTRQGTTIRGSNFFVSAVAACNCIDMCNGAEII